MTALLFAYGSLRSGEKDHHALDDAKCLGTAVAPAARLVDLGPYPALVQVAAPGAPPEWSVVGEVYAVDEAILARLDTLKRPPSLFQRCSIPLADGRSAQTYVMTDEQLRGRKRLPSGDWKKRFQARRRPEFTEPRRWNPR